MKTTFEFQFFEKNENGFVGNGLYQYWRIIIFRFNSFEKQVKISFFSMSTNSSKSKEVIFSMILIFRLQVFSLKQQKFHSMNGKNIVHAVLIHPVQCYRLSSERKLNMC